MMLPHVRRFVGKTVKVEYRDRLGNESAAQGEFMDVKYVPMYGTNLIFDFGEIALDRIVSLTEHEVEAA